MPANTEDRYGTLFHQKLIGEAFDKIVYSSINHFDTVFAEFQDIIDGMELAATAATNAIFDLYNNVFDVINSEGLAAFRELIQQRMDVEKEVFADLEQRIVKLAEQQAVAQKAAEIAARKEQVVAQGQIYPTVEDLKLRAQYAINPHLHKPEFEICVEIARIIEVIEAAADPEAIEQAEQIAARIEAIYNTLGIYNDLEIPYAITEISSQKCDLYAECYNLYRISLILQRQIFTLKELQSKVDAKTKAYLLKEGDSIAEEMPVNTNFALTIAFIVGTRIIIDLQDMIYCNDPTRLPRNLKVAVRKTKHLSQIALTKQHRAEIRDFFATHCNVILPRMHDLDLYRWLLRMVAMIVSVGFPFSVAPEDFYHCDQETLELYIEYDQVIFDMLREAEIPVMQALRMPIDLFRKFANNFNAIKAACNGIIAVNLATVLSLPHASLGFVVELMREIYKSKQEDDIVKQCKDTLTSMFNDQPFTNGERSVCAFAIWQLQRPDIKEFIFRTLKAQYKDTLSYFLLDNGFSQQQEDNLLPFFHMFTSRLHLDGRNANGDTPLHVAVTEGNPEIVQALLVYGADIQLTNAQGLTALQLAQMLENLDVLRDLKAAHVIMQFRTRKPPPPPPRLVKVREL